ncbi:hypothetical protein HYFRA_00009214 [Hymenoscyphus fraxineus]|uniref:NACHT domain-containing protein n=1 Tax=Hymenoscyphus fraxineus TaxID=746836 RepID=A0A9N9PSF2_9HELO|nr:hypothetical protein HYFRA_00009214 [Hymenoscyphus fraxineus]
MSGAEAIVVLASNATGLPKAFREVAARLPIVEEFLKSTGQRISDGQVDEASCNAMKPLIENCEERAKTLDGLFQKVLPANDASRLDRYINAAKTLGKGGKVEELMKGLMNDLLLLSSKHGVEAATAHQVNVDQLTKAIEDISAIEPSIPDSEFQQTTFTNNNFADGPMTNNNVLGDQKFQANYGTGKQFQAETQTFNMSILDQLEFPGMNDKYDELVKAHAETFQWIYERPELKFLDWLKDGKGVYWITGKAACGKSTLMKFLFEDPRTYDILPKNIENTSIFSFFFHDREKNPLLKSQEGLFRAIIHSILSKYRKLIPIALPMRWEATKEDILSGRYRAISSGWSTKELKDAFKAIVSQEYLPLHLCLFIDGLDEFSGEHQDIIDSLADLLPVSNESIVRVQICMSSRPLTVFEYAYLQHPHLMVQDLTAGDIKLYVTTNFQHVPQLKDLMLKDKETANLILQEILKKAEGVFLWVTLVVRSLIESLNNRDDMKTLQQRLSVLPAGLEPLYKRMLDQIDPFYHKHAAQIFCMIQTAAVPLSPLMMSFAEEDPRDALSDNSRLSNTEITDRHLEFAKRLKARTAGLIEIRPSKDDIDLARIQKDVLEGPITKNEEAIAWEPSRIEYLHLTVKEFLHSENIPIWLVNQTTKATTDAHVDIVACCLRQIRATASLFLNGDHNSNYYRGRLRTYWETTSKGIIFFIMFHAREAERINKTSQLAYLEAVDAYSMRHTPPFPSHPSEADIEQWHWTIRRYHDWSEPSEWMSDYVAYLIAIGMTRSVIDKFNRGYKPATKMGRPLLLYAACCLAPYFTIGDFERDTVDPIMVKELLRRKCDPNQFFNSLHARDIIDHGPRTVWEAVLYSLLDRFSGGDAGRYFYDLDQNQEAKDGLMLRWLKTIKLFLDYGADPAQIVIRYDYIERKGLWYSHSKISALSIFNRVFSNFDNALVPVVRNLMVSKGATEIEGLIPTPYPMSEYGPKISLGPKSSLRHIPIVGKYIAIARAKKNKR